MAHAIETGERITRHELRATWSHSSAALAVAHVPTFFFIAGGIGVALSPMNLFTH
jgi:hypothetical protein